MKQIIAGPIKIEQALIRDKEWNPVIPTSANEMVNRVVNQIRNFAKGR